MWGQAKVTLKDAPPAVEEEHEYLHIVFKDGRPEWVGKDVTWNQSSMAFLVITNDEDTLEIYFNYDIIDNMYVLYAP